MPIQKITSGIIQDGAVAAADIASVNGSVITANTIANSAIQTGAVEAYMRAVNLDFGLRNRIINGDMRIDQRNAGANGTSIGVYTLDRWGFYTAVSGKGTWGQNLDSVTPPVGFTNYLGWKTSSAYSPSASEYFIFQQALESNNAYDLAWGTANAKSTTLSFWVRSSLTGTFGGSIRNDQNNYTYPFSYTISAANTWEQKIITIAGPTGGSWSTGTNALCYIDLTLGAGSSASGTANTWAASNYFSVTGATNVVGTLNATWYVTGVQFEEGASATSFEYRPIGTEIFLCQRYYQKISGFTCVAGGATDVALSILYPVPMRATPTVSQTGILTIENIGVSDPAQSSTSISVRGTRINATGGCFSLGNFSGLTQFRPYIQNVNHSGTDNYILLTAEL
jgi:hypothetical protein